MRDGGRYAGMAERGRQLFEKFLHRAMNASLYEAPADLLFQGTALVCDLVSTAMVDDVNIARMGFHARITSNGSGEEIARWQMTPTGTVLPAHANADDPGGEKEEKFMICQSTKLGQGLVLSVNIIAADVLDAAQGMISEIMNMMIEGWISLGARAGTGIILQADGKSVTTLAPDPEAGPDSGILLSRARARMREVLQRFEEFLPAGFRVNMAGTGAVSPSQLFFAHEVSELAPCAPIRGQDEPRLSHIMAHEDLRVVRDWLSRPLAEKKDAIRKVTGMLVDEEGIEESSLAAAASELLKAVQMEPEDAVEEIRDLYERPVPLMALKHDCGVARSMLERRPSFSGGLMPMRLDDTGHHETLLVLLIGTLLQQLSAGFREDRNTSTIAWPVMVLGKVVLVLQLAVEIDHPLTGKDTAHEKLMSLVTAFDQIGQAAHLSFADLYYHIMADCLGHVLLDLLISHEQSPGSARHDQRLKNALRILNHVSAWAGRITNIPPLAWVSCEACSNSQSLWRILGKIERWSGAREYPDAESWQEMRYYRLRDTRQILDRIGISYIDDTGGNIWLHLLTEHLLWRIGEFLCYQLPDTLMLIQHVAEYTFRKDTEVLRHETGSLISRCREMVVDIDDGSNEKTGDLRFLLKLLHRTIEVAGNARNESQQASEPEPIRVRRFFDTLHRIYGTKYTLQTECGIRADARYMDLLDDDPTIWINEEDLYAIWKNLWDNARLTVLDYTRQTPGDSVRSSRRSSIIETLGPYPSRHGDGPVPTPVLITLLRKVRSDGSWICLEVIDNTPQLAGCALRYPARKQFGHFGLRLVCRIIEQLCHHGREARFFPVRKLPGEQASEYGSICDLAAYDWDKPEHWSWTAVWFRPDGHHD